ncbi:MAG: hypothetical protein COT85_07870 [Chlamydiae bacterium CG10_big_fil_rev_8_21_14_0_10_42_34]|nr:MAG: hypothetical protein COT85_07870 [Chlamydiae bacterium CG10_big_fil_rev_8_21_14_0_10_42_34]
MKNPPTIFHSIPRNQHAQITDMVLLEDLKPNDSDAINNGLISLYLALSIAEDALNEFANNRYRSFDALLGNNSCYLVSYNIYLIAHRFKSQQNLTIGPALNKIRETKQKLLIATNSFKTKIKTPSVGSFLSANNIHLDLDPDFIYLAMAYACTQAKEKNEFEFEETNYKNLLNIYSKKLNIDIPKKTVINLVKHWQKTLSISSIKTLRQRQTNTPNQPEELWREYLSDRYILTDKRDRLCAPSLYSAATIFSQLTQIEGAILGLQVNIVSQPKNRISTFTLFYQVQKDHSYRLVNSEKLPDSDPIYMFVGCRYISDIEKIDIRAIQHELEEKDLKTIILAHEVTYPQYPKSLNAENILPTHPEIIEHIKKYKKLKGFSLEDPSILCLAHIFIDDILTQSLASYDHPTFLPQLPQKK